MNFFELCLIRSFSAVNFVVTLFAGRGGGILSAVVFVVGAIFMAVLAPNFAVTAEIFMLFTTVLVDSCGVGGSGGLVAVVVLVLSIEVGCC